MVNDIKLIPYTGGALGRIIELHGRYYAANWGLGLYFETKIASEMAEFMSRFNPECDGAWFAQHDGEIIGSLIIDGSTEEKARLRWFIIDPAYHGAGLGNRMMDAAMAFCREKGFEQVYLTTFNGLNAARHLYEKHGFVLQREEDGSVIGNMALIVQIFEWKRA